MATRFTRLSVVAEQRQLDASLPAGRPVAEFLADLSALFNLPTTNPPTAWALSTPRHGLIAPERSLDEAGVLDGDVLYLSPALAAAESPVVDDVLTAITDTVDKRALPWAKAYRDWAITSLLAAVVLALVVTLATLPNPHASGAALLVAFAIGIALVKPVRTRGGQVLGWASLPAAVIGLFRLTAGAHLDVRLAAAVAAGLVGVATAAAVGRHNRALVVAGAASGVLAAGVAGLLTAGVDGSSIAAWATPPLVLALGVLPQLALSTSGLLGLVQRAEEGKSVQRGELTRALRFGQSAVDGSVIVAALVGSAAAATLVWAGQPAQAALGGLLGVIFLFRSRGFSAVHQVGYLLAVPVAALIATVAALPLWVDVHDVGGRAVYRIAGVVLVAVLVTSAGYTRVSEVSAARLSRLWDRLDTIATIALIPTVLLAQDVFGWLFNHL